MNEIEVLCEICKKKVKAEVLKKEKHLGNIESEVYSSTIQYGIVKVQPHSRRNFENICCFSNTYLRTIISLDHNKEF